MAKRLTNKTVAPHKGEVKIGSCTYNTFMRLPCPFQPLVHLDAFGFAISGHAPGQRQQVCQDKRSVLIIKRRCKET